MTMEGLGRAGAWLATGALVLSVHVAAAAWAMRQPGPPLPAAPEAILLDLAPPPAGEPAPASEEVKETAEAEPDPASEPRPEFTPPEIEPLPPPDFAALAPPEPVPDFAPPPVVPLPPPDFASLAPPAESAPALVPPPRRRPERLVRREGPREEPRDEPRKEPRRDARREPDQPRAERREARREKAQPSPAGRQGRNAEQGARQASAAASGASRQAQATWEQRAGARISQHMSRTRVPGKRGGIVRATVTVSVAASGATRAQLTRGTGDPDVDSALARQAARMPKLPPPPNGQARPFTQPFEIRLR